MKIEQLRDLEIKIYFQLLKSIEEKVYSEDLAIISNLISSAIAIKNSFLESNQIINKSGFPNQYKQKQEEVKRLKKRLFDN